MPSSIQLDLQEIGPPGHAAVRATLVAADGDASSSVTLDVAF
jgi:hypothetical protein